MMICYLLLLSAFSREEEEEDPLKETWALPMVLSNSEQLLQMEQEGEQDHAVRHQHRSVSEDRL